MKFPALLLLLSVIISCQKEPDVDLGTKPPEATTDSLSLIYFSPDSVIAGMTIKIGGTGFDIILANNIVTINGVPVTILTANDSVITAQVPETASTGKVAVTVNGATVTSLTDLVISQKPPDVIEQDIWVKKADFPGSLASEGPGYFHSFSLNGKGYYLKNKDLWEYSPETNSWIQKSGPPIASKVNSYGFCFTVQDKAYIGLGGPGPGDIELEEFKQVWQYNATTDNWTQKNNFPGSSRVGSFSFAIGTTGYIGGGDTLNANISDDFVFDFWKYETTTDSWTRLTDFPGSRSIGLSGVTVENSGFLVELGANSPTAPFSEHKDIHVWKYDPGSDSWEKKAKIPTTTAYAGGGTSFVINNKIYLAAGVLEPTAVGGESLMQNFWMYDPVTNNWTNKKDIGDGLPRLFNYGFAIDGKGYVGMGTGAFMDEVKTDFWEYNP